MKHVTFVLFAGVLSGLSLSGCTSYNANQDAKIDATTSYVQNELTQARERNLQLESDQALLNQNIQQLSGSVEEQRKQIQQLQSQITELQAANAQLNSARQSDRKEIVDQLTKTVVKLVNDSRPVAPPTSSGRVHVVEQGHTLSSIAAAFGVTVDAIKRANKLRSDVIRVGQELIIPD